MKRRIKSFAWGLALVSVGAWFGWSSHQSQSGPAFMSAQATPQVDFLVSPDSFSRVQNTKATLEGLCLQIRLKARGQLLHFNTLPASERDVASLEPTIRSLEQAMRDFEGTDQELELAPELLAAVREANQFDRWIDIYLRGLYRYPTHPVVVHKASEAIELSRVAGRQKEVLAALSYVDRLPIYFAGKERLSLVLTKARSGSHPAT